MPTIAEMLAVKKLQQERSGGTLGAMLENPLMAAKFARQKANVSPPMSVMDPRYTAWKKAQDDADKFLLVSDLLGAAVPFAGPAAKLGMAGARSLAPKAGQMAENYMAKTGMLQPITAYHGSPHKFDAFDASKIGTGEGAQAYGHGLYLAESPQVAQQYRTAGPNGGGYDRFVGGKPYDSADPVHLASNYWDMFWARGKSRQEIADILINEGGTDAHKAAAELILNGSPRGPKYSNGIPPLEKVPRANLYTVDLPDEHIAKMLDWDKPLSQQSAEVQALLQKAHQIRAQQTGGAFAPLDMNQLGRDVIPTLGEQRMQQAGIPGIKYLDGGSRGAGSGTRNFVVFPGEEKALKILERK